ncbi:hypothetical protein A1O3_10418 [Capronia epimyces CBS 606.96]|uniref:TPR-like protein n=1 Tax=Capronia epimyces CBS 606.96 TaxID=1182542 RepID=W9XIS3_9EURO|nr:uncharacterized protein A1O3_10418 [Capronia epimyces CBS 606.96]EXJ77260.1 hypothetical protein A1O3_10418 [Capronia epimyces CBS 606.96]
MSDQNEEQKQKPFDSPFAAHNDPMFRAPSYPWMAHLPPVPPDRFPVFEGYVPNSVSTIPAEASAQPGGPQYHVFPAQPTPQPRGPQYHLFPAQPAPQPGGPYYHAYPPPPALLTPLQNNGQYPQEIRPQHQYAAPGAPVGPFLPPPPGPDVQFNYSPYHSERFSQLPRGQQADAQLNQLPPTQPLDGHSDPVHFPPEKLDQLHIQQESRRVLKANATARTRQQDVEASAGEDELSMDDAEDPERPPDAPEDAASTSGRSRKRAAATLSGAEKPTTKRRKKGPGTRGGWSKGLKIGPRKAVEPGVEFTELHKKAMNAFIDDQDTDKALELILQAIAVNPEIYAAHALLSEIYFAKDENEKAIAALFSGAHSAPRDAEVWHQVASACVQRSTGDRQTALQQASYCYARIIHNDGKDFDARLQRAAVQRELGNYTKAMKDLEFIREHMPRNSNVLRQIAEVCIDTRDLDRAKSLYEEALSYYRETGLQDEESFTWADVLVYAQLLAQEEPPDVALSNAISTLKRLSRWLLGRDDETYWDEYSDDDREWDSEDDPRRTIVDQFVPGKHPPDAYGSGLPLELRVRLGVFRLRQGQDMLEEALAHFEWLEPEARDEDANVYEYPDLFLEAAQALNEAKEHNQALRYFEALKDLNAYSDVDFWLGVASNSYICGNKMQAIECYEEAKAADENCIEARTQLSKLYADLGEKENAMENAREAVRLADNSIRKTERRKYERKDQRIAREEAERALKQAYKLPGPSSGGAPVTRIEARLEGTRRKQSKKQKEARKEQKKGAQTDVQGQEDETVQAADTDKDPKGARKKERQTLQTRSKPGPKPKRMTAEDKEAHRTENINRLYRDLVASTEAMREGDEIARNTWMDCAESLTTDFRSNRVFYPAERHVAFTGYDRESRTANSRKKWEKDLGQVQHEGSTDQDFPLPSVESSVPTEYREISFSDWLDIFLEYALLLANSTEPGSQHRCYTIITAALDCAVWHHDPQAVLQIYITYFTCALALRDAHTLFNVALRWFMRKFRFCTDAYRLFAGLNLFYPHAHEKGGKDVQMANAAFRTGPSQKFMFRQVMTLDMNLPQDYNPESYGPVPDFMRHSRAQLQKEDAEDDLFSNANGEVITPKEMDVVLLTIYGHILYAGGSFANGLSYFFRARSLDPKNPVVLLSIALSYMHELLKRQNDNRHMYFLQGWAFFEEYADARRDWAKAKYDPDTDALIEREIEFNRARCWHMMGMSDLAVRAYAKVLSCAAPQGHADEAKYADYTMDAAYAIQTMYALSGNPAMARVITEKYLVV